MVGQIGEHSFETRIKSRANPSFFERKKASVDGEHVPRKKNSKVGDDLLCFRTYVVPHDLSLKVPNQSASAFGKTLSVLNQILGISDHGCAAMALNSCSNFPKLVTLPVTQLLILEFCLEGDQKL